MTKILLTLIIYFLVTGTLFSSNISALSMHCYDIQALLIDNDGKRLGFDKQTGKIVQEIHNGTYSREEPEGLSPYYWLDAGVLRAGLYRLVIVGTDNNQYTDQIDEWDEIGNIIHMKVSGIISKGEEQYFEINYSTHTHEKTTIKKIVDINLLETEIKHAFEFKIIENDTLNKELFEQLKQARMIKNNRKSTKNAIQMLTNILQKEKDQLVINSAQKKPNRPRPKDINSEEDKKLIEAWNDYNVWVETNIEPLNILLGDAKELLEGDRW
jgi:hypothetical protein